MKEFVLPELGENIETADVLRVLIAPGDQVQVDQNVIEIETDKATIEVPSTVSGTVKEVMVKEGQKAKVGETLFTVDEGKNGQETTVEKPQPEVKKVKNEAEQTLEEPKEKVAASDIKEEDKPKSVEAGGKKIFKLPELGENILSADVLSVKVAVGDRVEKDQILFEIETDKATIEVPSDTAGIVSEINFKAGDQIKVGQDLFVFETGEPAKAEEPKPEPPKAQPEKEEAPKEEKEIAERKDLAVKEEQKREEHPAVKPKDYIPTVREAADPSRIAPAAPTVRRFAREIGIDINLVKGTGPGGRISIDDVKTFARESSEGRTEEKKTSVPGMIGITAEALPDFSKWGEVERKDMSNIRRKTAEHLSYSWTTIPHVTQFDKADITELERLRKMYAKKAEQSGGKLTVTAILLKIIASAMKAFPQFSSSVDMENKQLIFKKYINIGIAVDTEYGLLVPVIKNVDKKNIIDLSVELNALAEKARNKKLSLDEMQGGCFTITNLGGIGGTYFTPVVNSPEVAILGVSRGSFEQVYIDNQFEARLMLPLSLSYDHRVIDGADAIRFLRWVIDAIQQPFLLALEG